MSKTFTNYIRVRYGETDQMGFVYYGNYALYLEVARTELIRSLGFTYKNLEEKNILLPVNKLNVEYRKAALYDDELRIETKILGDISRKLQFFSSIYNLQNELLAEGMVVLWFVNRETQKIMTCPQDLLDKLKIYQADV